MCFPVHLSIYFQVTLFMILLFNDLYTFLKEFTISRWILCKYESFSLR